MRRILVIVTILAAMLFAAGACAAAPGRPGSPPTSAPVIIVPNVIGDNAAVAVDRLARLGFTNIDLGTVDGHRMVILPQNWTVKTQSAAAGQRLPADTKIVLGCARIE